jgi:hypothetical protein
MGANDNRGMNSTSPIEGVARLTDWGVIRARGADAANFLHGQLTSDIAHLGASQARLAGYCSAQGRLLASFIAWRPADDEVLLASLEAETAKAIRVMRRLSPVRKSALELLKEYEATRPPVIEAVTPDGDRLGRATAQPPRFFGAISANLLAKVLRVRLRDERHHNAWVRVNRAGGSLHMGRSCHAHGDGGARAPDRALRRPAAYHRHRPGRDVHRTEARRAAACAEHSPA